MYSFDCKNLRSKGVKEFFSNFVLQPEREKFRDGKWQDSSESNSHYTWSWRTDCTWNTYSVWHCTSRYRIPWSEQRRQVWANKGGYFWENVVPLPPPTPRDRPLLASSSGVKRSLNWSPWDCFDSGCPPRRTNPFGETEDATFPEAEGKWLVLCAFSLPSTE